MGQMLICGAGIRCPHAGRVLERTGHDWAGQTLVLPGGAAIGVTVSDDAVTTFAKAQAVIDFTAPDARRLALPNWLRKTLCT
jgi:4-hydroxy-tetrahydrodipicolinate reductase